MQKSDLLIALGSIFLLNTFFGIHFPVRQMLPVALVLLGASRAMRTPADPASRAFSATACAARLSASDAAMKAPTPMATATAGHG